MSTANTQRDEQLVDALDEALNDIRRGTPVDVETWRQSHPEFDEEVPCLLQTLIELSQAADTWRGIESSDKSSVTRRDDLPKTIGRYQIHGLVGSGAMGDVFEGYDPQLDRRVAVKVPRCEKLQKDRALFTERFLREARAAAAVRHARICPVYDAGEDAGQPYVVMAFVEGESLESVLKRGRFENVEQAVELATQVADALQAIHEHGIIHRDLKPGNILIDRSGNALLTDFGLAVSIVSNERITSDGMIVGTPVYMSPEQAAGENSTLTSAADIYSFGAVFYEMLTGKVPFRAPLLELLRLIKSELPESPLALRSDLDPVLAAVPLKAMAKSPADRFASAAEMSLVLRRWHAAEGASDVSVPATQVLQPFLPPSRRHWMLIGSLGFIGVIVLGIAISVWINASKPTVTETAVEQNANQSEQTHAVAGIHEKSNAVVGLSADFSIIISSDPAKGPVTKNRLRVEERGAYPLRNGELVQFEARTNQPAYIYLLWVSPDGSVTPLYPWDAERFEGFSAPQMAGSDQPKDHVLCPSSRKLGFEASDPVGLQTFVMLARRSPLPAGVDLEKLLGQLPAGPKLDTRVASMQPQLRGIKTGQTKSLDYALFDELEARLSPHFELLRMMTFPQVAE